MGNDQEQNASAAFIRLKDELQRAFDAPDETYVTVTAEIVLQRLRESGD